MKRAMVLLVLLALASYALGASHGPVFGLATPTNSQGEWSFDQGAFGRSTSIGTQTSIRELVGYGSTPHLTLSFTLQSLARHRSHRREFNREPISIPHSRGFSNTEQRKLELAERAPHSVVLWFPAHSPDSKT
jgi:hypothetical protein